MSASDHLSNVQFMHVDDIGQMESGDFPQTTMAGYAADPWKAAREHPDGPQAERYEPHEWGELSRKMERSGPRGLDPLHIGMGDTGNDAVMDGHHRYRVARQLGWTHMPVVHEHDALEAAVAGYHANRAGR